LAALLITGTAGPPRHEEDAGQDALTGRCGLTVHCDHHAEPSTFRKNRAARWIRLGLRLSSCPSKEDPAMIDLHYWPTPNGKKVTILLEELGMPYKIVPVNIGRGDQFKDAFLEMNPNHRMPVMVDTEPTRRRQADRDLRVSAIMMYIAEKAGKFIRRTSAPNTK